ncbi:MAG: glycosyltransferase family protein [Paludibacter sp.]
MEQLGSLRKVVDKYTREVTIGVLSIIGIIQGIRFKSWNFDDSYIVYRYTENIISGNGWVYNIHENINASTSFLNTVMTALVGFIFRDVVLAAHIVATISLIVCSSFMYLLFVKQNKPLFGVFCALFWLTNPLLLATWGLETNLYCMLVMVSAYYYYCQKYTLSSIFLALLFLARPDGIILVAILFVDYIVSKRSIPLKSILVFVIILIPWAIFSIVKFGSLFPSTFSAKISQGESGLWGSGFIFIKGFVQFIKDNQWFQFYFAVLLVLTVLFGLLNFFQRESKIDYLLFIWGGSYFVGYSILNVPNYHWYYAPVLLSFGVFFFMVVGEVVTQMKNKLSSVNIVQHIIVFCVLSIVSFGLYLNVKQTPRFYVTEGGREQAYKEVGNWVKQNIKDNENLASAEIGVIGFYSKKRILDLSGLVTPLLKNEITNKEKIVAKYKPGYIVIHNNPAWQAHEPSINSPFILMNYDIIKTFDFKSIGYDNLSLLKRKKDNRNNSYDFIGNFYSGTIINVPEKTNQTDYVRVTQFDIYNEKRTVIFNHPPGGIIFDVKVKKNAKLNFGIAIDPNVWQKDSSIVDGVKFIIFVKTNNRQEEIFSKSINPSKNLDERKWFDFTVALNKYEGQNVKIIFCTNKNGNSTYDWAGWSNPYIN